jgi:uncharacterized repeat protein (TIGR01451 family)
MWFHLIWLFWRNVKMSKVSLSILAGLLVGSALAGVAGAQTGAAQPSVTIVQELVRSSTAAGKTTETYAVTKTVTPGDVLRLTLTLTNPTKTAYRNVLVGAPIDKATAFVAGSALSSERLTPEYSADNGKTFAAQPKRTVTVTENGKSVTREVAATPNDYTNVRWVVGSLKAGESYKLTYRVRVR